MPDYQLIPVYWHMNAVFTDDSGCIGVVFDVHDLRCGFKRVFFCCKNGSCYYGQSDDDAVDGYLVETYVKT